MNLSSFWPSGSRSHFDSDIAFFPTQSIFFPMSFPASFASLLRVCSVTKDMGCSLLDLSQVQRWAEPQARAVYSRRP